MKNYLLAGLCCLTLNYSEMNAAAAPAAGLLLKTLAGTSIRLFAATAALGPSIMTVTIVGTVAAVGEADADRRRRNSTDPLTLPDIARGWLRQWERVKDGYNVIEGAVVNAYQEAREPGQAKRLDAPEGPPVVIVHGSDTKNNPPAGD